MKVAPYFENTTAVALLRTVSGDRIFRHRDSLRDGTTPSATPPRPDDGAPETEDEEANKRSKITSPEQQADRGDSDVDSERPVEQEKLEYLVTWDGDQDPTNPKNFPSFTKWFILLQIGILTFIVTVSSSIFSGAIPGVMSHFDCSPAVAALGISLFVAGYGLGPMLWGPLSEIPQIGRNLVNIPTLVVFLCLQIPTALAGNLGTLLAMRFLGGFVASPVLAVGGGSIVDIFEPHHIPYCLGIWGSLAALGPVLGPLFGGYAYQNHGWRWPMWVVSWMAGFTLVLTFIFLPETSGEKILSDKAARLRKATGNPIWKPASERVGRLTLGDAVRIYMVRPIALLIYEPIVLLLSLYLALLYGLEYLFFEAFPFVYGEIYGWTPGLVGLSFFGVFIGIGIGMAFQMWFIRYRYGGMWRRNGCPPPLEEWLWTVLFGAFCVPVSMFWFGWAGEAKTHWIVPIIGSLPFGFALYVFFQGILTYLALAYTKHAASALAANDLLRCGFAAGFPIFTHAMYKNLGAGWASSIPGFISIALIPVPFIFYKYGAKVRAWSRYAD